MKRLSDAELMVMQVVWQANEPVTSANVQARVTQSWKPTSILTFLARLVDKGFLSCARQGKCNLYTPLVREKDYLQREGANLLARLYMGSVKSLMVSLADAGAVTQDDLDELRAFLDAQGGDEHG